MDPCINRMCCAFWRGHYLFSLTKQLVKWSNLSRNTRCEWLLQVTNESPGRAQRSLAGEMVKDRETLLSPPTHLPLISACPPIPPPLYLPYFFSFSFFSLWLIYNVVSTYSVTFKAMCLCSSPLSFANSWLTSIHFLDIVAGSQTHLESLQVSVESSLLPLSWLHIWEVVAKNSFFGDHTQ